MDIRHSIADLFFTLCIGKPCVVKMYRLVTVCDGQIEKSNAFRREITKGLNSRKTTIQILCCQAYLTHILLFDRIKWTEKKFLPFGIYTIE